MTNSIRQIDRDTIALIIKRRSGKVYEFLFDAEDHEKVAQFYIWRVLHTRGGRLYCAGAKKRGDKSVSLLHRVVNETPDDLQCYFWETHNTFDCRKRNLINGTHPERAIHAYRNKNRGEPNIYWHNNGLDVKFVRNHKLYAARFHSLDTAIAARDAFARGAMDGFKVYPYRKERAARQAEL